MASNKTTSLAMQGVATAFYVLYLYCLFLGEDKPGLLGQAILLSLWAILHLLGEQNGK